LSFGDFDAAIARQIGVRARAKHDETKAIAALNIVNDQSLTNGAVPSSNRGNTRVGGTGALAYHMNPIVADASLTYTFVDGIPVVYKAPFPIKLGGDYINNPNAGSDNQGWSAGVQFGKAGKVWVALLEGPGIWHTAALERSHAISNARIEGALVREAMAGREWERFTIVFGRPTP